MCVKTLHCHQGNVCLQNFRCIAYQEVFLKSIAKFQPESELNKSFKKCKLPLMKYCKFYCQKRNRFSSLIHKSVEIDVRLSSMIELKIINFSTLYVNVLIKLMATMPMLSVSLKVLHETSLIKSATMITSNKTISNEINQWISSNKLFCCLLEVIIHRKSSIYCVTDVN